MGGIQGLNFSNAIPLGPVVPRAVNVAAGDALAVEENVLFLIVAAQIGLGQRVGAGAAPKPHFSPL